MKRIILFLLFLMYPMLLFADIVYFDDGTSIEGEISNESETSITIKVSLSPAVIKFSNYPKSKITRIERQPLGATIKPEVKSREEKNKPQIKVLEKKPTKKSVKPEQKTDVTKVSRIDSKYRVAMRKDRSFIGPAKMNRIECTIIVPNYTTDREFETIFLQVLKEELNLNKDLDALWIIAYSEGKDASGIPKVYGIWSPPNGWDDFKNTTDKTKYKWEHRFIY